MKKLLFSLALMLFAGMSFGQLKVVSNGFTGVGPNFTTGGQTPGAQLHVANSGYTAVFIESASSSAQLRLRAANMGVVFDNAAGAQQGILQVDIPSAQYIFNNNTNGRFFWLTNNNRMVFTNTGRLGVGNAAPAQALDVNGSAFKNDGSTTWLTASDRRLKKDVEKYTDGLEQIMEINPVRFTYNGKGGTKDGQVAVGIIAQEMQKVASYMIGEVELSDSVETEFDANDVPSEKRNNTQTYLSYDANALPYMLVNAIQEQQALIEAQAAIIADLQETVKDIQTNGIGSVNESEVTLTYTDLASLDQNIPNPFNGSTTIQYAVPSKAKTAVMNIFDLNGKVLKTIQIKHLGEGQLTVNASDIPSGTYTYQLVVDGQIITTKKMILTK